VFKKIRKLVGGSDRKKYLILSILYLVLVLLAMRGVLWPEGTIGWRHDWSVPERADQIVKWFQHAWWPWIDARGGFSISYLSDYLVRLSLGWLGYLGVGGNVFSRAYIVVTLLLTGVFAYSSIKKITKDAIASLMGSMFYTFNPLVFNKIIAGHINYWIAYALAPLFVGLTQDFLDEKVALWSKKYWRQVILASLVFAVCGVQLQFFIMLSVVYWAVVLIFKYNWKKAIWSFLIIGIVSVLVHLPWLVVLGVEMVGYKNQLGGSGSPTTLAGFWYNASNIYQSLALMGSVGDYFSNSLKEAGWLEIWWQATIVIITAIIYFLNKTRERIYWGFFVFYVTGVLLLAFYRIFPEMSEFILNKSLIFNFFREVYHATFLVVWSMSVLVGLMWQKMKQTSGRWWKYVLAIAMVIFVCPFFADGKLLNNLQTFSLDNDQQVSSDNNDRVWYWPGLQPLLIDGKDYSGFDPSIYYAENGSISQMGRYTPLNERFATFLQSQMYFNSREFGAVLTRYLSMNDISQIIMRRNIKTDLSKYTLIARYTDKAQSLANKQLEDMLDLYQDKKEKISEWWDKYVFATTEKIEFANSCYLSGNWSDLNNILKIDGLAKCNETVMAKDTKITEGYLDDATVVLNNNNWFDLMIKQEDVVVIESGLWANQELDIEDGWVTNERAWWFDEEAAAHPDLIALTNKKDAKLQIDLRGIKDGSYQIYVEKYENKNGGQIAVEYRDYYQTIDTQSINNNMSWEKVGVVEVKAGEGDLMITNVVGSNMVGLLALVPDEKFDEIYKTVADSLYSHNKIVMENVKKVSNVPEVSVDLNKDNVFYENFPEYSQYDFKASENEVNVMAKFGGSAEQNEFATMLYDVKIDNDLLPIISVNAAVENNEIGFWEMALDIDQNGDGSSDLQLWKRLNNGDNLLAVGDFFQINNLEYAADTDRIVGIRFQPHKEYGVDMNDKIKKEYNFKISNLKFMSDPGMLVRVPRQADWLDIDQLKTKAENKLDLSSKVAFYNDFAETQQSIDTQNTDEIVIKSKFSEKDMVNEFGSLIVDTNVNIWQQQYMTIDLGVEDEEWQYYDLALQMDTDYDNVIDQTVWVESIKFDKDSRQKTIFYDLMAILQGQKNEYYNPRLLGIKILPHRVVQIPNQNNRELKFRVANISFYQEGEIVQSQTQQVPTMHVKVNMPQSGEYEMFVNVDGNANDDSFLVGAGGQDWQVKVGKNEKNAWKKVGIVNLDQGDNWLTLISYNGSFVINNLAFFKTDNSYNKIEDTILGWKKDSPVKYTATIDVIDREMLVFKESYHPAWKMKVYKQGTKDLVAESRPILVNGWQQGYDVNLPDGSYDVVWEYDLTSIYHILLIVSGVFLAGCGGWLVWASLRK